MGAGLYLPQDTMHFNGYNICRALPQKHTAVLTLFYIGIYAERCVLYHAGASSISYSIKGVKYSLHLETALILVSVMAVESPFGMQLIKNAPF